MPWVQKGHSITEVSHVIQYVAYFEVFGYIIEPKMRPTLLMDSIDDFCCKNSGQWTMSLNHSTDGRHSLSQPQGGKFKSCNLQNIVAKAMSLNLGSFQSNRPKLFILVSVQKGAVHLKFRLGFLHSSI